MLANKNGHEGGGMEHEEGRTMAEIAADILDLGPFLPGTVRRDFRKYVGKDGRERQYEVQPRVNLKVGEKRVDKRIPKEMFAQVLGQNGYDGVSTFYGYYMIEAMSAAGESQRALDTVRDYWGAMLDVGATSFWEDFKLAWTNNCFRIDEMPVAGKKDIHGDYGEFCYPGFRHSLCHGWAGGPAAWCINHVLGIRPLDVGCKTVEVKPFLGDLEWAEGSMALPDGTAVKVKLRKLSDGKIDMKISSPDWVKIVE